MDAWIKTSLEEMGRELGRLRRGTLDTQFQWEVERLCDRLFWILNSQRPSAGDMYREFGHVNLALSRADAETRRMNRLLGSD